MNKILEKRKKLVTFGEVLMRFSPAEKRKIQQSNKLDFFFGGSEMNVAASLANFGVDVQHITNVSNDLIGDAAIAYMRQLGIDVSTVNRVEQPLGLYFLEVGASMRSSRTVYNRMNGAFANISPNQVEWKSILETCNWLHWSGITPAISAGAYKTLKIGLELANKMDIEISADPSYRRGLWTYGKESQVILSELISYSTVFIGGINEMNKILKTNYDHTEKGFIAASKRLINEFPRIKKIFDKVRYGINASRQKIYGRAWVEEKIIYTKELEVSTVIDRVGSGDAYAAGVLYGLKYYDDQKTLEFAIAACALKHTILGDVNLVGVEEIKEVMNGSTGGMIKR